MMESLEAGTVGWNAARCSASVIAAELDLSASNKAYSRDSEGLVKKQVAVSSRVPLALPVLSRCVHVA